jgi:hypothetical protein
MRRFAHILVASLALPLSAAPRDAAPRGFAEILGQAAVNRYEMKESVPAGFVVSIQKDGIGVLAPGVFPNAYKNGTIRHLGADLFLSSYGAIRNEGRPVFLTDAGIIRDLSVNERVNVVSIEFLKGALIVVNLQTCGACDHGNPDPDLLPARASVTLQLGKPYLSSATSRQVEEVIANVFAPAPAEGGNTLIVPPPAPAQAEITAAMGQPLEVSQLNGKVVYTYRKLKFTFLDGKVSDIE